MGQWASAKQQSANAALMKTSFFLGDAWTIYHWPNLWSSLFRNSEESELVHFSERLRSTNRALHCAFRGHFVSDLLAMRLHSMSANATRLRLSSFVIGSQGFMLQSNTTMKSWRIPCLHQKNIVQTYDIFLVETRGFEPLAFWMPFKRATNCAMPPL